MDQQIIHKYLNDNATKKNANFNGRRLVTHTYKLSVSNSNKPRSNKGANTLVTKTLKETMNQFRVQNDFSV